MWPRPIRGHVAAELHKKARLSRRLLRDSPIALAASLPSHIRMPRADLELGASVTDLLAN